jgi:hypothetical protein
MRAVATILMIGVCAAAAALSAEAAELAAPLRALQAVGPKGAGQREAAQAWATLVRDADAAALPAMLEAMDGANPLAANWIRTAIDAVAERGANRGEAFPAQAMEKFVLDVRHSPQGRRLAYEWLLQWGTRCHDSRLPQFSSGLQDRLLRSMLDDPSLEMRRDAVERLADHVAKLEASGQSAEALAGYQRALAAARDLDQVRMLAGRVKQLGGKVDLPGHFGFVTRWQIIGPFDNGGPRGFDAAYPPERKIDLAASYAGKAGPVKWVPYVSRDELGVVDFNEALGEQKSVAAYAAAEFFAKTRRKVELRCTSDNAVKLWLNGRLLDAENVNHSGSALDQYVAAAVLEPGRNAILLKVCQNDLQQEWARGWSFQLRVCDALGTAILSAGVEQAGGR